MTIRPKSTAREALRLIDAEPVLDARTACAGAMDLRLLLRAARRSAARHAAAGLGNPPRQDLVAHRFGPRRRAPVAARYFAGRSRRASPAHARKASAFGRVPGEGSCRWPTKPSVRSNASASSWSSKCRPSATRCARRPNACASNCHRRGAGPPSSTNPSANCWPFSNCIPDRTT